jgi:hypothetical protein
MPQRLHMTYFGKFYGEWEGVAFVKISNTSKRGCRRGDEGRILRYKLLALYTCYSYKDREQIIYCEITHNSNGILIIYELALPFH